MTHYPSDKFDLNERQITLQRGAINYADNFIKPYYTVDLTNIRGEIEGFGTRTAKPADVEVHGLINSVSSIDITGSINPLAPPLRLVNPVRRLFRSLSCLRIDTMP